MMEVIFPIIENKWYQLTTPAYSWYENDVIWSERYGALYNWYAVNTGKLCPAGWHVPTDNDWLTLENYLIENGYNYDGTFSGNKIALSLAAFHYLDFDILYGPDGILRRLDYPEYRNKSGFSAVSGNYRSPDNQEMNWGSNSRNKYESWWSLTLENSDFAFIRRLGYSEVSFYKESRQILNGQVPGYYCMMFRCNSSDV